MPVCYVRGVETFGSHNEAPDFPRGSKAVYEPMILLSSYAQLLPHFDGEPIRIPADISPLVQKTYQENTSTERFLMPGQKSTRAPRRSVIRVRN